MSSTLSRRDFLKGSASLALSAGLLGAFANSKANAETSKDDAIHWSDAADLLVVGGGGAGFTAAIEAARAGTSVLILEKGAACGGDTRRSGGMIMAAGTPNQKEMGIEDSVENFIATELGYNGNTGDPEMVREMCMASPDEVKFMEEIGREFPVITQMNPVYGYDNLAQWAPRVHWAGSEARTGHFELLEKEAANYKEIRIRTSTEIAHIIKNQNGEVIGVTDVNGKNYRANKGVLLSTASFGHNLEMSKRYNPMNAWALRCEEIFDDPSPNLQSPLNTGDGIRMAQEIGADLALVGANCICDPTSPSFDSLYGTILVNNRGKRFVQENAHWGYMLTMVYNEAVRTNGLEPETPQFWYIADQYATNTNLYLMMLANGMSGLTANESYFKWIQTADTIEELAEKINIDPVSLRESVDRWNELVANGEDTDFHRADIEGITTDFTAIGDGPYYAFPLIPYSMGAFGGLRANRNTQVLNTDGEPIPRLYAAGSIISGMFTAQFYNACGWSILGTLHWGRKAAQQIGALDAWTTEPVEIEEEEKASGEIEAAIKSAEGNFNAGTYTATANGRNGEFEVSVTFSEKAITAIEIGENAETPAIGTLALEKLPQAILLAQSPDVDAITGATMTSNGLIEAVKNCIEQAKK